MDQNGVVPTADATTGRRRRQTLWEQMSAIDNGSRNSAVLGDKRQPQLAVTPTPAQVNRTLLDIIRDEESSGGSLFGHSNKKSWKAFRERIRIRRAGSAWTSSIHVPTSDIPIIRHSGGTHHRHHHHHHHHSLMSKKTSVRFTTVSTINTGETAPLDDDGSPPAPAPAMASSSAALRPMMMRRSSTRFAVTGGSESDDHAVEDVLPARSFRPQMSRHNSTRFPGAGQDPDGINDSPRKLFVALADERAMSAREAVAAQEAAEAAAAQAAAEDEEEKNGDDDDDEDDGESPGGEGGQVRMSLMDLLEETDRQMGLEGSKYTVGDEYGDVEDDDGDDDDDEEGPDDGVEHTCCVCMVRHKGSAFIPCGHTFCRLCSRELWVQRGNCPLCNGFILEILDIF